jgi:hypothetical protein
MAAAAVVEVDILTSLVMEAVAAVAAAMAALVAAVPVVGAAHLRFIFSR